MLLKIELTKEQYSNEQVWILLETFNKHINAIYLG